MTKIKICGLTCAEDVAAVNCAAPEYAGFVMFYNKSKRNITPCQARLLLNLLDKKIIPVAVTVKPTPAQLDAAFSCGFSLVQIHGDVDDDVIASSPLPVLKAFNVNDICDFERYRFMPNIAGFVFDAAVPGSGKTFDWEILKGIPRFDGLFVLAGGLDDGNVRMAIELAKPDVVDVSSGVEGSQPPKKDKKKLDAFVRAVRGVR